MADRPGNGTAGRAQVLAVLGALGTGVGVVGFVTVVGGAVLWIRFHAVGIPADQAVAAIPSGELVTTGLSTLIPYLVYGVAAAFIAYLFAANNVVPAQPLTVLQERWSGDGPSGPAGGRGSGAGRPAPTPIDRVTAEAVYAADMALEAARNAEAAAVSGRLRAARREADRAAKATNEAIALADLPPEAEKDARQRAVEAAQLGLRRARAAVKDARAQRWSSKLKLIGAGAALVAGEMVIVCVTAKPEADAFLGLALIAIVLTAFAIVVGWRTRGFALFGAAVFLSVLFFGTFLTLVRTDNDARVQAAAVLRQGPDYGVTGYYLGETSDRVYVARVGEKVVMGAGEDRAVRYRSAPPRIVILPRSSVVSMIIGPSRSREKAYDESLQLLQELCRVKVREATTSAKTPGAPAGPNPCPPKQ